ncbi:MAG: SDR family NAD(P)-dependent oxidoreductase [Vulcanimicrobiaceae bacterium]
MTGALRGKHALVTGGGRGIGRAISGELAARGARVSVVSRSAGVRADITSAHELDRAFEACRRANGPICVLVNNAGIAESAPFLRTDRAMWDRIVATNLTGTFLSTQSAIGDMIAAKWGRVVNVASIAGLFGAPYISAYCASKHGVVGLTRALAAEFAATGVTFNVVCPGYTETDMMRQAIESIVRHARISEDAARDRLAQSNPGGRILSPEEVACAVADLCEGEENGREVVLPQPA